MKEKDCSKQTKCYLKKATLKRSPRKQSKNLSKGKERKNRGPDEKVQYLKNKNFKKSE